LVSLQSIVCSDIWLYVSESNAGVSRVKERDDHVLYLNGRLDLQQGGELIRGNQ